MRMDVPSFLEDVRARVLPRVPVGPQRDRVRNAVLVWKYKPMDEEDMLRSILGMEPVKTFGETAKCSSHMPWMRCEVRVFSNWLLDEAPRRIAYTLIHELAHVAVADGHTQEWADMCKVLGICEIPYEGDAHPIDYRHCTFKGGETFADKELEDWITRTYA